MARSEIARRAAKLGEPGALTENASNEFAEKGLVNLLLPVGYGGVETSFLVFSMILRGKSVGVCLRRIASHRAG